MCQTNYPIYSNKQQALQVVYKARDKKTHIISISETTTDSMIENSVIEIENYVVEEMPGINIVVEWQCTYINQLITG